MAIEKMLNETNLKWQDVDDKEMSVMANNIFEAYKESLMFGKYKGDVSSKRVSRMGVQHSNLNLFTSQLNNKLSQYLPPQGSNNTTMKGMARQISNKLSELRSNFLFKASRMPNQSKINFKKKKSNPSELRFSKYKRELTEQQPNTLLKKTTFSKNPNKNGSQSTGIYSVGSVTELDSIKDKNKMKTNEILQEMEGVEDTPKDNKETEDGGKLAKPEKAFFGKLSSFSVLSKKPTRKLLPKNFDDDNSFDGIS